MGGKERFMEATDLYPCVAALGKSAEDGKLIASVMNTTTEPVTSQKGQLYGPLTALGQWGGGEKRRPLNVMATERKSASGKVTAKEKESDHDRERNEEEMEMGENANEWTDAKKSKWIEEEF